MIMATATAAQHACQDASGHPACSMPPQTGVQDEEGGDTSPQDLFTQRIASDNSMSFQVLRA